MPAGLARTLGHTCQFRGGRLVYRQRQVMPLQTDVGMLVDPALQARVVGLAEWAFQVCKQRQHETGVGLAVAPRRTARVVLSGRGRCGIGTVAQHHGEQREQQHRKQADGT